MSSGTSIGTVQCTHGIARKPAVPCTSLGALSIEVDCGDSITASKYAFISSTRTAPSPAYCAVLSCVPQNWQSNVAIRRSSGSGVLAPHCAHRTPWPTSALEPLHERDVILARFVLAHAFARGPRVPLRAAFDVEHAGPT